MPARSFRDLRVWSQSVKLVSEVYRTTQSFPAHERFGLIAQLRRAAVSIPANIAEGYGRSTRGEYLNQLSVARGSANEVEALFAVSEELRIVEPADLSIVLSLLDSTQRMLTRLKSSLEKRTALAPINPPTPAPQPPTQVSSPRDQ